MRPRLYGLYIYRITEITECSLLLVPIVGPLVNPNVLPFCSGESTIK